MQCTESKRLDASSIYLGSNCRSSKLIGYCLLRCAVCTRDVTLKRKMLGAELAMHKISETPCMSDDHYLHVLYLLNSHQDELAEKHMCMRSTRTFIRSGHTPELGYWELQMADRLEVRDKKN